MFTLDQLCKKMPIRIRQNTTRQVDETILADQLKLNCWLDEALVERVLGKSKNCVINLFSTDYGTEVLISGHPLKDTDEQTDFPGFYAAVDTNELSIPAELSRAASYIGRKFVPKLGELRADPVTYNIHSIDVDEKNKKALLRFKPEELDFVTEEEYWKYHVAPMISEPFDQGKAMHALAEAYNHQRKSVSTQHHYDSAWAREMLIHSLYCLQIMMGEHGRKGVETRTYEANQGRFEMDNLEFKTFYNPKTANKVFIGENPVTIDLVELRNK